MSERYWVTGADIGMLKVLIHEGKLKNLVDAEKNLIRIEDENFIGNMREPYEDWEIVIRRRIK